MKKSTVLTAALMMCAITGAAQLRYGVRIGGDINTAHLHDGAQYKQKHLSGFSGGLTLEYQAGFTPWAVDVSALYTYTGIKISGINSEDRAMKTGNDFLEVPLHVKYKFWLKSVKDLAGPYLYTGPALLIRLDKDEAGLPFETRRLQAGWDIGAGMDIVNFVQIQAGYRFGINNVISSAPDRNLRMRNDGVNISVAFLFDF